MAGKKHAKWDSHGETAIRLYEAGMSCADVVAECARNGFVVTHGQVLHFLRRRGLIRSKKNAQKTLSNPWPSRIFQEKNCSHCDQVFMPMSSMQRYCKVCVPDNESGHRMVRYGLSKSDCNALLEKQGGHCALCDRTKNLIVDHCHKTETVRGFLCNRCNIALGAFERDGWVELATKYLQRKGT